MDNNGHYPYDAEPLSPNEYATKRISVGQLQHLVQLLDESDVSEIEVKRADEEMRLVLRKARTQTSDEAGLYQVQASPAEGTATLAPVETRHTITSSLVGIFHPWSKPKGNAQVSVGDRIKVGQLVGMIQSLNVINEVESPVAGRVVEILIQDGQAVEYGQQLVVIDSAEEA